MDVVVPLNVIQALGVVCNRVPVIILELAKDCTSDIPRAVSFYLEEGIVNWEAEDRALSSSLT